MEPIIPDNLNVNHVEAYRRGFSAARDACTLQLHGIIEEIQQETNGMIEKMDLKFMRRLEEALKKS